MKKILYGIIFVGLCVLFSAKQTQAQYVLAYDEVGYNSNDRYVYGYSATFLDYYAGLYYDPEVSGLLFWQFNNEVPLDEGYGYGIGYWLPAQVYNETPLYLPLTTYDEYSTHFIRPYFAAYSCFNCWYDPFGFSFFNGGTVYGGYYPWYSSFFNPNYYISGRAIVVGRLDVFITTPLDICQAGVAPNQYYVESSVSCPQPSPGVSITVHTETSNAGIPIKAANAPPATTGLPYRNSTVVSAMGVPTGGTYSWSKSSNKVTIDPVASDSTSSRATINAVSPSESIGDVVISITYTAPNNPPRTIDVPMTVQQATSFHYVSTDSDARINTHRVEHTNRLVAGWKKVIRWQLYDHLGQRMSFRVPVSDTLKDDSSTTCRSPRGKGTLLNEGKGTSAGGEWVHTYLIEGPSCVRGGNCSITGFQEYSVNGFLLSNDRKNYTYTCNGISVLGDGTTQPTVAPPAHKTTEEFVDFFWLGSLDSIADDSAYQFWANGLNAAQTQGLDAMLIQARALGRSLFQSTDYVNLGRTDEEFVRDLYLAYLQREPDQSGYDFWLSVLRSDNAQGLNGREHLLQAFELSGEFINLVSSLVAAPPIEDACDPVEEQSCYVNGGDWDPNSCTCIYPPPDPCWNGQQWICEYYY